MNDPLRIFTEEQLKDLTPFRLQQLKKEFSIPFRFEGKTFVTLNNHQIDKGTLTEIFNELESNLELHLEINKNKILKDLFEKDSLSFLSNESEFNAISNLIQKHPTIEKRVAGKLSLIIANILRSNAPHRHSQLKLIQEFTEQLSPENAYNVFQLGFDVLEKQINDLFVSFPDGFKNAHRVEFKGDIGMHISKDKLNVFNYLPKDFAPLEKLYSKWCNDSIVNQAGSTLSYFKSYKKRDLAIFKEAAEIAQLHFDSPDVQLKLKNAKAALKPKPTASKGISWFGGILGVVLFLRFIYRIANYSDRNSRNSYRTDPTTMNQQDLQRVLEQNENYNKLIREIERKKAARKETNDSTSDSAFKFDNLSLKAINKKYNGEDVLMLNSRKLRSRYKLDTIIMDFESDIFPTTFEDYASLLPKSVEQGGKAKTAAAYLTFRNSSLNFKTSHLVDIFYNIDNKPPSTVYTRMEKLNQPKLSLRAKRIPYGKFNLKGFIQLKDVGTGELKEKTPISIKYSPSGKMYEITVDKKIIALKKDIAENYSRIPQSESLKRKFAILINDLGLLHNKYLKEKNYYALNEIPAYDLNPGSSIETNKTHLRYDKGNLRFSFASSVDNFAYCELDSKKTSLRYIFDFDSGVVKALMRSTTSMDKSVVEQIVLVNK